MQSIYFNDFATNCLKHESYDMCNPELFVLKIAGIYVPYNPSDRKVPDSILFIEKAFLPLIAYFFILIERLVLFLF